MFTLQSLLTMRSPLRMAVVAGLIFTSSTSGQTYSSCNPTKQSGCTADTALGTSLSVNFQDGASDQFTAQGNPTYDHNGAAFTVAQSGQAPTIISKWYIMFGKVSVTLKAAPGQGIVSSAVLQSDDLDEIDWEWLGGKGSEVQSNYFGKGQTTTYDRAAVHAVDDTQGEFHTYDVEWTENQIVWMIDGKTVRVLNAGEANGQYPQTPMQLKLGAWAGGDPANTQGTIDWAGGLVNYAAGPFTMYVSSLSVVDYSTGKSYSYGDMSGSWESIKSDGGEINSNSGGSVVVSNAPAITSTSSGNEPWTGTHATNTATVSYTSLPGLPSGWTVSGSGKVVPPSAAPSTSQPALSTSSPAPSPAAAGCSGSGYKVVTKYNEQGFLTTATIPAGASTGWDDKGMPTTVLPANCMISNPPMAAGEVLKMVKSESGTSQLLLASADASALITAQVSRSSNSAGTHCAGNTTSWIAAFCTLFLASAIGMVWA
ncbi:glycoside hydrolase family 16 protein [Dothistroma septosporum NZE10]|uniref:chitinase n=1 Tax=Dothistroma septosporum (strain NZE10 / CBS 128990) TaxID=675120 RepID=N1PIP9_DOTSN|nr:glycoside hydrolase family 16 protein [Dothistroma septosporum NZE10]